MTRADAEKGKKGATRRGDGRSRGSEAQRRSARGGSSSAKDRPRSRAAAKSAAARDRKILTALLIILALASLLLIYSYVSFVRERTSRSTDLLAMGEQKETLESTKRNSSQAPQGKIANGIRYADLELGGLLYEEAEQLLSESEKRILSQLPAVELRQKENNRLMKPYELGLRLDIPAILEEAADQSKNLFKRSKGLQKHYRTDAALLDEALAKLAAEIDQEAADAEALEFNQDKLSFVFAKEKAGRKLDLTNLRQALVSQFANAQFDKAIELSIKETPPGRTAEELSKHLAWVASASTPIMYYDEGRNFNVKLAADRISGQVLKPGEIFSYNAVIGPMSLENGFRLAGIQDADGNDSVGVGGGLCQPSTTLYQAAVRANLEITEHHFHSTPVGYCPIGTDAMVCEWADMKFKNNSDYPYAIVAYFDGATLGFDIYGPPNPDHAVIDLSVQEESRSPNTAEAKFVQNDELEIGETSLKAKERDARSVAVYKTFTVDGQLLRTELLYRNTYPSGPALIAVNKPSDQNLLSGNTIFAGFYYDENGNPQPSYVSVNETNEGWWQGRP